MNNSMQMTNDQRPLRNVLIGILCDVSYEEEA